MNTYRYGDLSYFLDHPLQLAFYLILFAVFGLMFIKNYRQNDLPSNCIMIGLIASALSWIVTFLKIRDFTSEHNLLLTETKNYITARIAVGIMDSSAVFIFATALSFLIGIIFIRDKGEKIFVTSLTVLISTIYVVGRIFYL